MFIKADLDDDGFVTADDFYNIMTHKVYWDQWGKNQCKWYSKLSIFFAEVFI